MVESNLTALRFQTVLMYPPMELDEAVIRRICFDISAIQDFTEIKVLKAGGAVLGSPGKRRCQIGPDRIILSDNMPRASFELFKGNVENVVENVLGNQERPGVPIPIFVRQSVSLRYLFPMNMDSREFFGRVIPLDMTTVNEWLDHPVAGIGLRMVMPPSRERKTEYELKLEPYFRNLREVYVEVNANFLIPIPAANPSQITENLDKASVFVHERVFGLLNWLTTRE